MYLSEMEGLIIKSKNFASLYSVVSIMLTTCRPELFISWTLIDLCNLTGLVPVGIGPCIFSSTFFKYF